jgi:hypothetical protein
MYRMGLQSGVVQLYLQPLGSRFAFQVTEEGCRDVM